MILGKLVTLVTWLKQTAQCLPIKTQVYGDATRLIALSRSSLRYPVLHIGRPIIVPTDNGAGHIQTDFHLEIIVLAQIENSGYAELEEAECLKAESTALDILLEFDRLLRKAAIADEIDYNSTTTEIQPTFPGYIDKATGFKLVCAISTGANSFKNVID
jgi:hypothetical protein